MFIACLSCIFVILLNKFNSIQLSVLLYGSKCWPISTSLCSRLSMFDMQAQWTNVKWFDCKTNIEVRSLTKRQPIQRYIAQRHLRWFWPSTPVSTPSCCTCHLHLQPEGWSRPLGAPQMHTGPVSETLR